MKKSIPLLFPLFLFVSSLSLAQSTAWTPIYLTPTGSHVLNGIEAYFQRSTCGDDEVVLVRFVNTNDYSVVLQWYNAVFTEELTWISHDSETFSLTLAASSSVTGDCTGETTLVVPLSGFLSDPLAFKRFCTVELSITKTTP